MQKRRLHYSEGLFEIYVCSKLDEDVRMRAGVFATSAVLIFSANEGEGTDRMRARFRRLRWSHNKNIMNLYKRVAPVDHFSAVACVDMLHQHLPKLVCRTGQFVGLVGEATTHEGEGIYL